MFEIKVSWASVKDFLEIAELDRVSWLGIIETRSSFRMVSMYGDIGLSMPMFVWQNRIKI